MQTFGLIVGAWTEGVGGPMGGGKGGEFYYYSRYQIV